MPLPHRVWIAALEAGESTDLAGAARQLVQSLDGHVRIGLWRATRDGWLVTPGDGSVPATPPHEAVVLQLPGDFTMAVLVDADDDSRGAALAVVRTVLERVTATMHAAEVQERLDRNERIANMGSYDWHIPTDSNRWSDGLYRVYGEPAQSFNASYERFMEFVHPDDREAVQATHAEAFETGEPYEKEERIVLRNGEVRTLWTNGVVIFDEETGEPLRVVGICRDVTEQRRMEDRARHHERELGRAEELRRQAMELNDNVIQGLATALLLFDSHPQKANALVDRTLHAAQSMMTDLLEHAGTAIQPGDLVRQVSAPGLGVDDEPPPNESSEPGGDALRVVIADDSEDLRLLLRMQLGRDERVTVVAEAADGQQAIDAVTADRPDAVLLDLAMPRVDGLEAARTIREQHPDTRIVILSGYAKESMAEQAYAAGADEYIAKGTPIHEVIDALLGLDVSTAA